MSHHHRHSLAWFLFKLLIVLTLIDLVLEFLAGGWSGPSIPPPPPGAFGSVAPSGPMGPPASPAVPVITPRRPLSQQQ